MITFFAAASALIIGWYGKGFALEQKIEAELKTTENTAQTDIKALIAKIRAKI